MVTPLYTDEALAALYENVKRKPKEWSLSEAILHHAQACGLVAYTCNVHPDDVARAVADQQAA